METQEITLKPRRENQRLAAPQYLRSSEALRGGSEVGFIKETFSLSALRGLKSKETDKIIGVILQEASLLAGIKEGIQDFVKNDIKELIYNRFGFLSLEEIAFAFKLERQRAYATKTEHFQFFSTEYVAEILKKYNEWKMEIIRQKNIEKLQEEEPKLPSKAEKIKMFIEGINNDFEFFKQNGKLSILAFRHYGMLYNLGLLPRHTPQFREQISQRTQRALNDELSFAKDKEENSLLRKIIESNLTQEPKFKIKAREIIIKDFFADLLEKNKNITQVVQEKIILWTKNECVSKKG